MRCNLFSRRNEQLKRKTFLKADAAMGVFHSFPITTDAVSGRIFGSDIPEPGEKAFLSGSTRLEGGDAPIGFRSGKTEALSSAVRRARAANRDR